MVEAVRIPRFADEAECILSEGKSCKGNWWRGVSNLWWRLHVFHDLRLVLHELGHSRSCVGR